MMRKIYKSLDRPVSFFGLKGKWTKIYIVSTLGGVILSLLLGGLFKEGTGIGLSIACVIGLFLICYLLQTKITDRQVAMMMSTPDVRSNVQKRETLSRILLDDIDYLNSNKEQ